MAQRYAGGKIARYSLAVSRQETITLPVSEELGRPEHDEGRWVSIAEADLSQVERGLLGMESRQAGL